MILYPNAKINIGLKVIEKRPDGFHNLETFFFPIELTDILEIVESEETTLSLYGISLEGRQEDNLCIRAYELLSKDFKLPPVEIHLFKRIPPGAGLGGGSSDAAHALIALNKLFCLHLSHETLAEYAARLGSDCPFFIYSKRLNTEEGEGMLAEGRGEILTPFTIPQLKGIKIKTVVPPVFVSTAEAYGGVAPQKPQISLKELLIRPIEEWKEAITNDFERTVFEKHPQIGEHKMALYSQKALYASMSGSGSAVFGLFRQ
ncbi:MAG: 4-(cytidine 5'-diphospho)-2-C-methyl-D-erythritol kinase [Bacteroidetes bacterium GWF2_40_14]|nr:MAG: 4-(cytidine 5'-diphospho)-2-C-methyl-D-erythritol kinase [Bacteroidetes bacterium GWF2_40_14]